MLSMIESTKKQVRNIMIFVKYVWKKDNYFKVNIYNSIKIRLKGFTSNQYVLYNLSKNDSREYITEQERWYSRNINRHYSVVLDDKLLFHEMFKNHITLPDNLFMVKNNRILDMDGSELNSLALQQIAMSQKSMFMKPIIGGGGKGIFKIIFKDNKFYVNDDHYSIDELYNLLVKSDEYIACSAIEQAEFSSTFYNESVNTIRIITVFDSEISSIKVTDAVHRFGTSRTGSVDNASKGGIFANIDVITGVMSEARSYYDETYQSHPDTAVKIKDVKIPGWHEIIEECKSVAIKFPYIPYMAWDVAMTKEGISVVEINASTDLQIIQIFGGKRNSELGKFLNDHNCLN